MLLMECHTSTDMFATMPAGAPYDVPDGYDAFALPFEDEDLFLAPLDIPPRIAGPLFSCVPSAVDLLPLE